MISLRNIYLDKLKHCLYVAFISKATNCFTLYFFFFFALLQLALRKLGVHSFPKVLQPNLLCYYLWVKKSGLNREVVSLGRV